MTDIASPDHAPLAQIPLGLICQAEIRASLRGYDIGGIVAQLVELRQMTQQQVADLLNYSQSYISRIIAGHEHIRDITKITRAVTHLGIPPGALGPGPGADAWINGRMSTRAAHIAADSLHRELTRQGHRVPRPTHTNPGRSSLRLTPAGPLVTCYPLAYAWEDHGSPYAHPTGDPTGAAARLAAPLTSRRRTPTTGPGPRSAKA